MFNWKIFKRFSTKRTHRVLRALGLRNQQLERPVDKAPPLRGALNAQQNYGRYTIVEYGTLIDKLIESINQLEIEPEAKDVLIQWEQFQSLQKGPVAPIFPNAGKRLVEQPFLLMEEDLEVIERSKVLDKYFDMLYDHGGYGLSRHSVHELDWGAAWKRLKPSTSRGYPYNDYGDHVDDLIMRKGGNTGLSVYKFFIELPQQFVFSGVRLQGTPRLEEGKVRMVNLPVVNYQYMNMPIYHMAMDHLKAFPTFIGGLPEQQRITILTNKVVDARKRGLTYIAIDFSKFDRCCNKHLRGRTYDGIVKFFSGSPQISAGREQMEKYSSSQYLMFNINGRIVPTLANNLLLSGVVDTQYTGSIINLAIQMYILEELKRIYSVNFEYTPDDLFALGDDVGIPIPTILIDKLSYKGLLSRISEIVTPLGFTVHDVKAYPRPDLNFLQKITVPEHNIIYHGSYARTLSSFMYKENYATRIPGIKSNKALELFSQIDLMSNVEMVNIFLYNFRSIFAKGGLDIDDGLRSILGRTYKVEDSIDINADRMVRFVIQLTTNDVSTLVSGNKLHSLDPLKVLGKLDGTDYSKSFNFSTVLVEEGSKKDDWNYRNVRDEFGHDISTNGDESNSGHVDGDVDFG